ncbi:MAG: metallophosphoesterase [Planctomycetota bacterium]
MHRLATLGVFFLVLSLRAGTAHAQQKIRPHTWSGIERIVAVGDVHGDHEQFLKTLFCAGVIDPENRWAAGKTHLVQTGDLFDRGPNSRKAMDLLMKLEPEAEKAGGKVHCLAGNHEEMILRGDWRYVHPGEVQAFGGNDKYRAAIGPEGLYGKWIRKHNGVIKINNILFLHGGLGGAYSTMSLDQLNEGIRKGLATGTGMARDSNGPLWHRALAKGDDASVSEQVKPIFKTHAVNHIVLGHTPFGRIIPKAGGKVILIDVGMSKAYGGPAGCLVIEKGVFYAVYAGHPVMKLPVKTKASAAVKK